MVIVCAFTGNRDLDDDGTAERFDITAPERHPRRAPGARPLTFGAGVHYCLGANLARLELQEALEFFARNVRGLELDGRAGLSKAWRGIYGLAELPLRLTL